MLFQVEKSPYREEVKDLKALFKTNQGEFTVDLFVGHAPETVWNFVNLAEGRQKTKKSGPFYDGLVFHRVIDRFMIQGGCPEGKGTGGPGYRFGDECHPERLHNEPGVLSMANAGPGTNGSQFFITLVPCPHLDGRHTVFGKVSKGLETIQKIGRVQTDRQDRPIDDIKIESVTILRNA